MRRRPGRAIGGVRGLVPAIALGVATVLGEPTRVGLCGAPGAVAAAAELSADADVQGRIRDVARARSEQDLASALGELRRVAPDDEVLVQQLALFLLDAEGEREGMAPGLIVSRLGISRRAILRGVEPALGTSDDALRAQLENLLGAVDQAPDGSVDFGEIRALVAERGAPPSDALVRYMFARAPAQAVAALAGSAGAGGARAAVSPQIALVEDARRSLAAQGRLGGDERAAATAALEELSRHPDWWMRAYAAAVAGDEPRLAAGGPSLLERLRNDADEHVRTVAHSAKPAGSR
jgi:hypothetical protein